MRYGMILDLKRCYGCNACTVICKQKNGTPKGVFWAKVYATEVGKYPQARREYLPTLCMHCANAPCVSVCPTGASYKREDGIVLVDESKCIGCRSCMLSCPYEARYFDFGAEASYFPGKEANPYEVAQASKRKKGTVNKCTLCVDRIDEGEIPACAQVCPTQARIFGDLESTELQKLIISRNGYQEKSVVGTDPSVYYLPR
ncbi:MAG: 4Fe-4S dicluster domain-containing protein [Peptococcaceae bacterium]|jgi:molybdopterin-containing oxidoreductase family iron-sulfur binding subunit|nr:4Fe-4S dicluster domain-containing protein [Peptococcaceae bacterium]